MKGLPIGISDFKQIIENDMVYVDKTRYLYEMIKTGKYYFLSRPRRFGKSLTISTLYYLFKAQRELFKDTWIHDKWEWKEYPVIRINLLEVASSSVERLEKGLRNIVRDNAKDLGVELEEKEDHLYGFTELIKKASEKRKVVVLIDEYEKPILDNITDREKAEEMRQVLREFYSVLKAQDENIRFVFITGITKFTKTGIFSALNNLNDISLDRRYSQMLGYTQEELEEYFAEHIEQTAKHMNTPKEELLEKIREYYNGFSFDGEHFVYNPFSILSFFDKKSFGNYWYESGSPSFLYDYVRTHEVGLEEMISSTVSGEDFSSKEIEVADPVIFFLQTGYLTFKEKIEYPELGKAVYKTGYPNKEVRDSMSKLLLEAKYGMKNEDINRLMDVIYKALKSKDIDRVLKEAKRVISSISYMAHTAKESYYQTIMYTLLMAVGVKVKMEEELSTGRSDLVIEFNGDVYVVELKLDRSPEEAIEQIKQKGYHEKYLGKNVYLVGVSVSSKKRNIESWKVEKI